METTYILFLVMLLVVCAFAMIRGGPNERLAAIALATAALLSPFAVSRHFAGPELGVILVDLGLFFALTYIALRSEAFWPMWAAGFQLCGVAVHLAAAMSPTMLPAAYVESLGIWSLAVLTSLGLGTLQRSGLTRGRN